MRWTSRRRYLDTYFALLELVPGDASLATSCARVEFIAKRRHIIADVVDLVLPGTTNDYFSNAASPY